MTGEPRVDRVARAAAGGRSACTVLFCCLALLIFLAGRGIAAGASEGASEQTGVGLALRTETPRVDNCPLGPGDLLEVRVFIEADGMVNYPLVGNLRVGGASISQFAQSETA